jgi:pyruvate,water dikinase
LEIQERNLGPKARSCIMAESGIVEVDNPSGKAGTFCLNDQDVICIAAAAKKIEEHFGVAQDIEWAIDEESTFPDKVVLLQARPEVIASIKSPLDQIVDLMLDRFSGGN